MTKDKEEHKKRKAMKVTVIEDGTKPFSLNNDNSHLSRFQKNTLGVIFFNELIIKLYCNNALCVYLFIASSSTCLC
jgi:hypothetical protein